MSNRWSPRGTQTQQRREVRRANLRERNPPPEPEHSSPVLTIVLILAAFTALVLCAIGAVTVFRLLLPG